MDLHFDEINAEQLEIIYRITKSLADMNDEENILDRILEELMRETKAEVGAFIYYDPESDKFEPRTVKTTNQSQVHPVRFSQTIFRKVLETREAVLSYDVQTEKDYQHTESLMISNIHALLAFPLIVEDRVYGIMYFDSRTNRQGFNESARQLLSFFAPIASLTLEQILRKKRIESENILLKKQIEQNIRIPTMIGESPPMRKLYQMIAKVAKTDVPVIIVGENGTGKDLVARAIHDLSPRKDKPFIAQYIGNIPSTIVESELFGYKKGAFTGADRDKIGLFEAVSGGTLFLDEIGDLVPELQTKLLRVLQNGEIKRLGENIVRKVNVRILTATNRDLIELVKSGKFREDLYYRLNVITIRVPPLRERKSDIPLLAEYFLQKENAGRNIRISRAAMKKLMEYSWPGNVRQLENIIKRASILASNEVIEPEDIQFDDLDSDFKGTLEEYTNKLILKRLEECNGNKSQAARSLGISLRSLQMKVKKMGL